jgi:hypothetical protein
MRPGKAAIGMTVTGGLRAASIILFVVMWNSTSRLPGLFGALAAISGLTFYALGWTRDRSSARP